MTFIILILAIFFAVTLRFLYKWLEKERKLVKAKENLESVETKVDISNINKKATKLKSKLKK